MPAVRADKATSINRMTHAPNGEPYPDGASYVQGYLKQSMNRHSITTVLNHKNDYVIFGKLIRRFPSYQTDVRTFYIPPYRDLKLRDLEAGSYKVHYEIVNTGEYLKNEPFTLGEMIDNGDNLRYPELILSANQSFSQITNHTSNESEFGGF
ncbi:MAG: hypothetical protein Q3971_04880 [Moraxella sp.]|nr:hypothetical protein [Moraxella sp.]